MIEITKLYYDRYANAFRNTNKHVLNTLQNQGINPIDYSENEVEDLSGRLFSFSYSHAMEGSQNNIWGFVGKVNINGIQSTALLHIKQCADRFIRSDESLAFKNYLERGNRIDVKLERTEKGLSASLIGVAPSFDYYIGLV